MTKEKIINVIKNYLSDEIYGENEDTIVFEYSKKISKSEKILRKFGIYGLEYIYDKQNSGYSDEYVYCECGHLHHTSEVAILDGYCVCEKCADYSDLLEMYINEQNKGFDSKILNYNEITDFLKENRFHKILDYDFDFGESTGKILKEYNYKLKNKYSFVWVITHTAMFGASAELYIQLDKKNGILGGKKTII